LLDDDAGPNTGGMGAYSPAPIVTPELHARVMREIIIPTIHGMAKDGCHFTGFLYAGLMIDDKGNAKTLEFNCRMGDPETQPIMARLKTDLLTVFEHAVNATLDHGKLSTSGGRVLCVVGLGDSVKMAQNQAYQAVEQIHFDGMQFRNDIGWRAIKRRP